MIQNVSAPSKKDKQVKHQDDSAGKKVDWLQAGEDKHNANDAYPSCHIDDVAAQFFINRQFGFFGTQPWFIEGTKGEFYIKKSWENNPFIKTVYLPNCRLVGPFHRIETATTESKIIFKIVDSHQYENKEITDSDFVKMRMNFIKTAEVIK